jgi:hypothetical protein
MRLFWEYSLGDANTQEEVVVLSSFLSIIMWLLSSQKILLSNSK